jgi:putative ABC transport system permease protein
VALAVVLLVAAGLLVRTFANLSSVDLGFSPTGILVGRMSLQGTSGESASARGALLDQALARIRQLPGVSAAAVSNNVPIEPGLNLALLPPAGGLIDQPRSVDWRYVTPEYFPLFQMTTRAGRILDEGDRAGGRLVAVVNEAFARTYFGRVDVIGQTIELSPSMRDGPREIVGVVADVKARSNSGFTRGMNALAAPAAPAMFVPATQAPDAAVQLASRFFEMKWIVRASGATAGLERGMQDAVRAVDPTLPFVRFESMTSVVRRDLDLQRLITLLLVAFAVSAMLLAAVGLYGVIAYSALQRRQEVGVRMALGATAGLVIRSFMREGLALAIIGLTLGAMGAALTTRFLSARLFGVTPLDTLTFASVAASLIAVAACAALIPATTAARRSPVHALRGE